MSGNHDLMGSEEVESLIISLRGHKVIIDRDLATLYEVETRALNQAIKRNADRFPGDFMFQLDAIETSSLAASYLRLTKLKFSRTLPFAFTEHGAIMAASVLNSPRAVEASIFVVRAFVKLRQLITTHKELAHKLAELERKLGDHDDAIVAIMAAIKELMEPQLGPPKDRIGFRP